MTTSSKHQNEQAETRAFQTLENILSKAYERARLACDSEMIRHYSNLLMEASLETW